MAMDDLSSETWSETEDLSVAGFNQSQLEGCYWYGAKRFEAILARAVFKQSGEIEDIPGLDTSLHELLSTFPYKAQLDVLRRELSFAVSSNIEVSCSSARQAYLTLVAVLSMKGSTEDKKLFATHLTRHAQSMIRGDCRENAVNVDDLCDDDRASVKSLPHTPPLVAFSGEGIDGYELRWASRALHQHGLNVGFHTDYKEEASSSPPGRYARVTCGTQHFEAIARNKKLAKQLAAVKACKALDVPITP